MNFPYKTCVANFYKFRTARISMEDKEYKKVMSAILLFILIVLSFLILKPVLISIVFGLIFAFIFNPVFEWLYKKTRSKNLSASIIIVLFLAIILLPLWFLTPVLIKQAFSLFQSLLQTDFVTPIKAILPNLAATEQFSIDIGSILSSFTSNLANTLMNSLSRLLLDFPAIALQLFVVFFTFFFVLRDKDLIISYVKSLLPFPKDVEKKLFNYSKNITASVLYGQILIGIYQGVVTGLGFIIFGVPNALLMSFLAILMGILPIIGPFFVWVPVVIYLFVTGQTFAAWGVLVFGMIASTTDNFLRPLIVSRKTKIHSAIILISMIGGLFFMGIVGLILGPLIIAYLLVFLEVYRGKKTPGIIFDKEK